VGSVEADDERQIAVADDWQLQRLADSSSTNTAAPYPGDIGGPSEQVEQCGVMSTLCIGFLKRQAM